MTIHPCAGHACDHCHLCDVEGICCASVSTSDVPGLVADAALVDRLRSALAEDADRPNGFFGRLTSDATQSVLDVLAMPHSRVAPKARSILELEPSRSIPPILQEKTHDTAPA
jgi:hypothetical protein